MNARFPADRGVAATWATGAAPWANEQDLLRDRPGRGAQASRPAGGSGRTVGAGRTVAAVSGAREPAAPADRDAEIAELRGRLLLLRRAAESPGAELRCTLDAVLGELESAIGMLGKLKSGPRAGEAKRPGGADAERRLLRAVFQGVPAPIFLLDCDGAVRRVNRQAATLLDMEPGSATGRPFTAFVDPTDRLAVRAQLTAVVRTGRARRLRCRILGTTRKVATTLTFDLMERPGDSGPLVMAVAGPANMPQPPAAAGDGMMAGHGAAAGPAVAAAARRFDLISAVTRLLLDSATSSEPLRLRRCASLLAAELTAWVMVDVAQDGQMQRLFVAPPAGKQFTDLTRAIEKQAPLPGSLPWEVRKSGQSRLIADAPDATVVGGTSSGIPVLTLLGATSVLCAPLTDGERSYGTLTLARRPEAGPFAAADLDLVDEIGQQLAVAIKIGRMFMRRSAVTEALQASLLPRDLPRVPGVEIATAYLPSAKDPGPGGHFYDVYPNPGGWGLVIGDVCGRGEQAAAATSLARYAIRVFAHWIPEPADVLRLANEILAAQPDTDRFVTAIAGTLGWRDEMLHVVLASAGHPGPLLVRPDGRVRVLPGGGLPLGVFNDARPATEQLDLEPGGLVFLYSDGATEARDPAGAYFEGRLANALAALAGRPAREVVAAIRDLVLQFSDSDLRADMTMVALRALDPPSELPGQANQRGALHGTDQL